MIHVAGYDPVEATPFRFGKIQILVFPPELIDKMLRKRRTQREAVNRERHREFLEGLFTRKGQGRKDARR